MARFHASPFVKWAGGKGQMLERLSPLFPPRFSRYYEPFLGGGAVFCRLRPASATLADVNEELINTYTVVRDSVEALITDLARHVNEESYFYDVRAQDPANLTPLQRASRLIFLNKTCFNGLYRVNRAGAFNVPFGSYANPTICDAKNLCAVNSALQGVDLLAQDFNLVLDLPQAGDFVYLDPPYHPLSATANFTGYAENGFYEHDQRRLAQALRDLDARGCFWLLSNSETPLINELYASFDITRLNARRAINSRGDRRGPVVELAIKNYE